MVFGGRSLGIAWHWQPVESTYISPFTPSRMVTVRLPPPGFPGGIRGSTSCHSLETLPRKNTVIAQQIGLPNCTELASKSGRDHMTRICRALQGVLCWLAMVCFFGGPRAALAEPGRGIPIPFYHYNSTPHTSNPPNHPIS